MKRRTFLKSATAAVAAPLIIPSSAWGKNAPNKRVNLALIGAGNRGSQIAEYTHRREDVRFVAVCDCFKERREGWCARLNESYGSEVAQPYQDFREVLAREDVDGIMVATPDHWHVHLAIAAARAGKDMYVEKPLGISLPWAQVLRKEVAKNEVVFQYGTQQRASWQFRHACELVRNGYIGQVERVEAWCSDVSGVSGFEGEATVPFVPTTPAEVPEGLDYETWLGPAPAKPYTPVRCTNIGAWHIYDYALGFIAGWGAHPLDIAQWGLDMDHTSPVRYEGTGKLPKKGLLDTSYDWDMRCDYANGVKMRFMSAQLAKSQVSEYRKFLDHGTTFFGSEGWVSVDRGDICTSDDAKLRNLKFRLEDKRLKEAKGHPDDFVECIKSRQQPLAPLEAAIRSDTISHLCDIAIRRKETIEWNPAREQIAGNRKAQKMLDRAITKPWLLRNL